MNHQLKTGKNDEYYTKEYAIYPIIKYLKPNSRVLCPFDTEESNYVKILTEKGFNVDCSHILSGKNFFDYSKEQVEKYDYIISNPPYSLRENIIEHLYYLGKPFAILINESGLFDSKKRYGLLKNNPFEIMVFNKRIDYIKPNTEMKGVPFKSVYLCSNILPYKITFEEL